MRKELVCSLLLAASLPMVAAHQGRVFVDKNNNGMFDKGEKVLKDVKVSDGLNVVKTDADGIYTLAGHDRERFVFITLPSGYKPADKHYHRIEAGTGSYDFALVPYQAGIGKNGAHRFIQVSDTEIFNTAGNEVWAENIRQYAANEKPAFIIHTGDICYEKGLREHINLMNTKNMNVPMFYCIGNHDLVKGKYGEETFEKYYGPVYYSFDVAGVHYIVTPMPGGDYQPGYTRDDVCRWMKNDLAHVTPETPIYIFNHDILTYSDDFTYKGKTESLDLNKYNLKAWIYGHWHINHKKKQGKVYTICTSSLDKGGIDHSTSAYRVMNVDGNGDFTTELRYTYLDKELCIASPVGNTASTMVTANVYSTVSPVRKAYYTCMDGEKAILKNKPLVQASDWTWNAEMPIKEQYEGKKLTLQVVAEFRNGERAIKETSFVYNPDGAEVELDGNWDNLAGNAAHTGVSTARLDGKLSLAWVKNVGSNLYMSSPLIHNGKVFTASIDEDLKGKAFIYAMDAKSGEMVWRYQVENSVKNTIAITEDIVFAQDVLGNLYAVDCETGDLRWKEKMPVNGLPALIEGLAADNGVVYAGAGKALSAFEAKTGKLIWRNNEWNQNEGTTTTLSVGNGVVIGAAQWSALYANDKNTGKKLWGASDYGLRNRGASAAIHNGLLYIISDKSFFIMDAHSGRIIVRKELPYSVDVTSTPVLTDKEIIFGTAKEGLVALDNQTLEEKWKCPVGNALVYTAPYTRPVSGTIETTPVMAGKTVAVGASDGTLYVIDKETGAVLWKHATGSPIFGSVAASGNTLIVTDFGGNVYAFTTK